MAKLSEMHISLKVLFSALIGIPLSFFVFHAPNYALFHYFHHDNAKWLEPVNFVWLMLSSVYVSIFGIILASPLILIAMLVARIFKTSIERYLILWCFIGSISVTMTVISFFYFNQSDDLYVNGVLRHKSFLDILFNGEQYIWAPIGSAVVFYLINRKKLKVEN